MHSRELLARLREYAVFSALDIERITGKNRHYAYLWIQRLKNARLIHEVEKGRYTCHTDPFLIASRIVWPAYISGWAALQFYHLTEQLPTTIEVMTTRPRKQRMLEFRNVKIEFSRLSTAHFFGYEKIVYRKIPIFIGGKEKALLDALLLKHLSHPEFTDILKKNKRRISIRRLKAYARNISKPFSSKINRLVAGND